MLAAINPQNTSLMAEYPVCHSQGELLYLISKNNIKEVFIDRDLPGNLSINAFIDVVKAKYPEVEISVVEPYINVAPEVVFETIEYPSSNSPLKVAIAVALIQTLFSIAIQFSTLTPRSIIYAVIAGLVTLIFFYGGYRWLNSSQQ